MQQLTAPPRDSLTADQVQWLLTGQPDPHFDRGLEVLDGSSLAVVADLTDYFEGGQVVHTLAADVHRTCTLRVRTGGSFDPGRQLLRPYMTISDGTIAARFNVGVFRAARPQTDWSTSPGTMTVTGQDLLSVLNRPIGAAYTISSGTSYASAARTLWSDAGMTAPLLLDGTNATGALAADQTWPVDQANTWLVAFNWVMSAMGYAPVWMDENGNGRAQPYQSPTTRAPQALFDFDDLQATIIAPDRQDTTDLGSAPVNVWVFLNQNVTSPTEGAGQYTVKNQTSGDQSIGAQGGVEWPAVVTLDVPDQTSLESVGDAQVDAALAASRTFTLHTRPYPIAGHGDVLTYSDSLVVGGQVVVQEQSWTLDLGSSTTPPADMEWRVGTVTDWTNAA